MPTVNPTSSTEKVNIIDVEKLNKIDLAEKVFYARGEVLDQDVRKFANKVEKANQLLDMVSKIDSKSNIAQYGFPYYEKTTWQVVDNQILLDNNYKITVNNTEKGNSFSIIDPKGNSLVYQNGVLMPLEKNNTNTDTFTGIPVTHDMTFILDNGTKVTIKPTSENDPKIANVYITRGNQGISISNLDGTQPPIISPPSIEGIPTSEKNIINKSSTEIAYYKSYDDVDNYTPYSDFSNVFTLEVNKALSSMSDVEKEALWESIKQNGLSIKCFSEDRHRNSDEYIKTYSNIKPEALDSSLENFINRVSEDYIKGSFKRYVEAEEGETQIFGVGAKLFFPDYSYEDNHNRSIIDTKTIPSEFIQSFAEYTSDEERESYDTITYTHRNKLIDNLTSYTDTLTADQKEGLSKKLEKEGMTFNWQLSDEDGDDEIYKSGDDRAEYYEVKMFPGETLKDFFSRGVELSGNRFRTYIEGPEKEGDIDIDYIINDISLPEFSYNLYQENNEEDSRLFHSLDKNQNDGYILLESGGVNSWEYNGQQISSITEQDPNNTDNQLSGLEALKQTFATKKIEEIDAGLPVLTQNEIDMLTKDLKILIQDSSNNGYLNKEEWESLNKQLFTARENLNTINQLDTNQLQRAMQMYTQNFNLLSNTESKLHALFKELMRGF